MPVNLSIKNVPDEMMAILEDAAGRRSPMSPSEFLVGLRALGLRTPAESRAMVREDRDGR